MAGKGEQSDYQADFNTCDEEGVKDIFEDASDAMGGPIECLINNAGWTNIDWLEDQDPSKMSENIRANLIFPMFFSREMARLTPVSPGGKAGLRKRIINTGSMATKMSMRASAPYCASKGGLEAFTRQAAKEFAGRKPIDIFMVSPCTIADTAMSEQVVHDLVRTRRMTEAEARKYAMQSPLGRVATHEEVWRAFDFFVNRATSAYSGTVLYLTAGMGL